MTDIKEDDDSYLFLEEQTKKVVTPEQVWAKINDDGTEAEVSWNIVELYAMEFDSLNRSGGFKTQTHVLCKLLVLVRDQVRKECGKV